MTDLALAAGAVLVANSDPVRPEPDVYNPTPVFALVANSPLQRFDLDVTGVFLTPRKEFVVSVREIQRHVHRTIVSAETMDILPPELSLSYELAVALGRQPTSLVGDDSPDVDLGSAL